MYNRLFPFLKLNRQLDWTKCYSENMASNKQWEETTHFKIGGLKNNANPPNMPHYEELPNLNYADTKSNWCPFFSNLLEETGIGGYGEPSRGFIDAWSSESNTPATISSPNESSLPGRNNLPFSALSLSMSNAAEDGTDDSLRSQPSNWMTASVPHGGPLAEVLQSSNATSPRNINKNSTEVISLKCDSYCGSYGASAPTSPSKLASSPSGVLQKALVSLSDSSSSSSPTFAPVSRSDFAFHWMNLNK